MKVILLLQKIGLISVEEAAVSTHQVVETRTVSLLHLLEQTEKKEPENTSDPAPEFLVDFDQIFQAMKVDRPEHGVTVETAAEILSGKTVSESKEKLLAALKERNVTAEEIIQDALNKDRALDSFEEFAYQKLLQRSAERERQKQQLKKQIEECENRMKELSTLESADEKAFQQWVKKKVKKEEELYNVVSALTSENQVSIGSIRETKRRES